MKKFLTSIDLFGEPVKVYINKKEQINTSFGGILSLLMCVIMVILAWFIGKDIIFRENPISYEQRLASNLFPKLEINETNFPFAVLITDFNNVPITDDTLIQLKLYYILSQTNEENIMETEFLETVKLEKCEYYHFPKLTQDQFDNSQLGNNYCLKQQNYTLQGFWGERRILYLNLAAEMCDYDTYPDYCKSHDEIVNYISVNGANFNIFYMDTAVNIKNPQSPFKYYINSFYKYFDSNKNKICEYFLELQSLVTDAGFIFEKEQIENYFSLREILTDTLNFNTESKQLLNFIIYSGNKSSLIHRKYIKATEILASLGGLIKMIHLVFTFGNMGFSRVKKFETVINHVFDFSLSSINNFYKRKQTLYPSLQDIKGLASNLEKTDKNFKLDRSDARGLNQENNLEFSAKYKVNNFVSPHSKKNKSNSIFSITDSILRNLKNKNEKNLLELSFYEVLTILCKSCCLKKLKKKKKFETFFMGETKIKEYFDFINIIIHLEEFEALKKIIFNDNQRKLFEMNINPKLHEERKVTHNLTNISHEKIDEHLKEFLSKISEGKNSEIDDNLLKYLLNVV